MSDNVIVTPLENGPLEVTGAITVQAPDGTVIRESDKTYLCRCGQSGNKPFCDGTHRKVGWIAE